MIASNVINQFSYSQVQKSDISLEFHVVFGMERTKMVISFVRSKVGFYLTWLNYRKEKWEKKSYFIFMKIITSKYIPTDMYTYQNK